MTWTPSWDERERWPVAVDPYDCDCTECLIGQYVPLQEAKPKHIRKMLAGKIGDNTSTVFTYLNGEVVANLITESQEVLAWRIHER